MLPKKFKSIWFPDFTNCNMSFNCCNLFWQWWVYWRVKIVTGRVCFLYRNHLKKPWNQSIKPKHMKMLKSAWALGFICPTTRPDCVFMSSSCRVDIPHKWSWNWLGLYKELESCLKCKYAIFFLPLLLCECRLIIWKFC